MPEYTLVTDSTCDLNPELYGEMGVRVIPMRYIVDGREYSDDGSLTGREFYDMLREGKTASTVQINLLTYLETFERELEAGRDILYLCFASELSGSYNTAGIAAAECRERWPGRRIIVIDSRSECGGEGLLALHAAQLKKSGMGIGELAEWIEGAIERHCHYFTVDDLNHLYRGGRLSRGAAVVGTLVGIKPVMYTADNGKLMVGAKARGRGQAIRMLAEKLESKFDRNAPGPVIINHADCPEDADKLAEDIRQRVGDIDIKILGLGPVIGAHVGPGCLALFFVGDNRDW